MSKGPATGNQCPLNWYRDDFVLGTGGAGNNTLAQVSALWQTAQAYCVANGLNGPTCGLHYSGNMPGSWGPKAANAGAAVQGGGKFGGTTAVNAYKAWLQALAPFCRAATYEITTNELFGNLNANLTNDPILWDLGSTYSGGYNSGIDGLINLIKLQRSILPAVLLGINDVQMCTFDGSGTLYNQQTGINAYSNCASHGAALDWLGCEGYGSVLPSSGGDFFTATATAIQTVGSQLVTTRGTGASNTIAFTEFTPVNGITQYTQTTDWQNFVGNIFANSPYVFGVSGPWGSSGVRRSSAFNAGDWFVDDTNNGGTDPDGAPSFNGHVSATLTWLQTWVLGNIIAPIPTPTPTSTPNPSPAPTPSANNTTIPTATNILDASGNKWTLSATGTVLPGTQLT
jgi:hypothetical protein